jgi:uncharacterized phage protein (TIGR02220 family)
MQDFKNWLEQCKESGKTTFSYEEIISQLDATPSNNKELCIKIIEYLNTSVGSTFTIKSKKTLELINARIKEGYTLHEFKLVIDRKAKQWLFTEQAKYLRPTTLFNATKFETYLNESEITHGKPTTKLQKIGIAINEAKSNW